MPPIRSLLGGGESCEIGVLAWRPMHVLVFSSHGKSEALFVLSQFQQKLILLEASRQGKTICHFILKIAKALPFPLLIGPICRKSPILDRASHMTHLHSLKPLILLLKDLLRKWLISLKVKRGQREGDGTENVTTISDTFPTISGTFTTFPMLCSCDIRAS